MSMNITMLCLKKVPHLFYHHTNFKIIVACLHLPDMFPPAYLPIDSVVGIYVHT